MLRTIPTKTRQVRVPCKLNRFYSESSNAYIDKVNKARFDCSEQLKRADQSSVLLSKFYPEYLQDSYLAIKSFNIELSKVSFAHQPGATDRSKQFNNLKFSFWQEQIDKLDGLDMINAHERVLDMNEPVTMMLADNVLKGLNINTSMLRQMISSHQYFYNNNASEGFKCLDDMCSFGEGTQSQMNYLLQSVLLSPQLKGYSDSTIALLESSGTDNIRDNLSDISAHLGQSTLLCSLMIALKYFAEKKQTLMLPTDTLTKHKLPEEDALRLLQGQNNNESKELLKNVIFDVATLANDHIITARTKLKQVKEEIKEVASKSDDPLVNKLVSVKNGLPSCIYLPYMSGIPTILYLERLEKCDFDVLHPKLQFKEWRLALRAWWNERNKSF
ncbi:hypothetical protein DAMA08_035770 [Martiniozyma asiatica (nom. inval.)]|nr:hypothetical protein DAMA08_035770 [Martiniozyma asiatica]